MSKEIVDSVIEFSNTYNVNIGLISSRRQIDTFGGYVNNWTTKEFTEYVRSRSKNITLVRDHGGPGQGDVDDDGIESFINDCKHFDIIHIDVWKKYPNYEDGLQKTIEFLELGYKLNSNLFFEVGTEEAIRRFETDELDRLMQDLKDRVSENIFNNIKYLVVQSGTALSENKNIGQYNPLRLKEMISICKKWNKISKEHNGDYISNDDLISKSELGLESINIAPEFANIQTKVILDYLNKGQFSIDELYQICFLSNRWIKWVDENFLPQENKNKLIEITAHYIYSDEDFIKLKSSWDNKFPSIDIETSNQLLLRLKKLHNII